MRLSRRNGYSQAKQGLQPRYNTPEQQRAAEADGSRVLPIHLEPEARKAEELRLARAQAELDERVAQAREKIQVGGMYMVTCRLTRAPSVSPWGAPMLRAVDAKETLPADAFVIKPGSATTLTALDPAAMMVTLLTQSGEHRMHLNAFLVSTQFMG